MRTRSEAVGGHGGALRFSLWRAVRLEKLGGLLTVLRDFKGGVEAYVEAVAEGGELWGRDVEDFAGKVAGALGGTTQAVKGL